ncbi:MAG: potassium transporter TrkG, partial [Dehalococcoidales bacterium]|nr:potassium transporter TrkG [Dehalococcoidales bacterium]
DFTTTQRGFMIEKKTSAVDKLVFRIREKQAIKLPIKLSKPSTPLSSTLLLAYGFLAAIFLGTLLLILPFASKTGQVTSPINALFTSTSAVCVTGLAVVDTGTYWSGFGQVVILTMIQIGGFGFLTGTTLLLFAIGGKFGLKERLVLTEQSGAEEIGGALAVVLKIAAFSLLIELIGVLIFYFRWLATGDANVSLWTAVFHAISAFNNSGMDLFGNFKGMIVYQNDAIILLTTAFLIIAGSTGYLVVADMIRARRFYRFSLDTKLVLTTTAILLAFGTFFYLVVEFTNPATLGPMPFLQKLNVAFFQSVSPRTAGFAAVDIAGLRQASIFFTMLLMFIGGASGSTAGGVKVNTIGILSVTALSLAKGRTHVSAFGRQLTSQTVYRAVTLFLLYLLVVSVVALCLSLVEDYPFDSILFETFSALGTVGLTVGITPALTIPGKLIITIAMFIGRLGPLALMAFLVHRQQPEELEYPHDSVRLG